MLRERTVVRYDYAPSSDTVRLHLEATPGSDRQRRAMLLLGASGQLVGVDLREASGFGDVVMWGPHEDVARTEDATVSVTCGPEGDVYAVSIPKAKAAIRTPERTPYARS